jgi:hypothetical protein
MASSNRELFYAENGNEKLEIHFCLLDKNNWKECYVKEGRKKQNQLRKEKNKDTDKQNQSVKKSSVL